MKHILIAFVAVFLLSCKKDEAPQPAASSPNETHWYDTLEWCTPVPPSGYIAICSEDTCQFPIYTVDYETEQKKDRVYFHKACDYYYVLIPSESAGDKIKCCYMVEKPEVSVLSFGPEVPINEPYYLKRNYTE